MSRRCSILAFSTFVTLISACGTEPSGGLLVGQTFELLAVKKQTYDCDPALGSPRDSTICGSSSGTVTLRVDSLAGSLRLDDYAPDQVCSFEGGQPVCRDGQSGSYAATVSANLHRCRTASAASPTSGCQVFAMDTRALVRRNATGCPGSVCADTVQSVFWVAVILRYSGLEYGLWGLENSRGAAGPMADVTAFDPNPDVRASQRGSWTLARR